MSRKKQSAIAIAHDAGGSEIIAAYVVATKGRYDWTCYVAGPASSIFRRERIKVRKINGERGAILRKLATHTDAKLVLIGTGWMTTIERDALAVAKELGMRTVVYLESWSGYRERFGYPQKRWKQNLPDEIWVGDRPALSIAAKQFIGTRVRLVSNRYFANMISRYRRIRAKARDRSVLYLSNAIKEADSAFAMLLDAMSESNISSQKIRVRFHPADDRSRYDDIIARYHGRANVVLSHEKDLVRDLSRACMVVGTETVAMAVSILAGLPTIVIASAKGKSQLPFPKIRRVSSRSALARLIKTI